MNELLSIEKLNLFFELYKRNLQVLNKINLKVFKGEKVAVGDPETVTKQLKKMKTSLNLSGFALEFNAGEIIPPDKVKESLTLFCKEVMPELR